VSQPTVFIVEDDVDTREMAARRSTGSTPARAPASSSSI
jgi:hypothetical protein